MKDTVEFINIAQDDVLAWPGFVHRTYPSAVNERMESTIIPFVKKSVAVNETVLGIFNAQLGLPEGTLSKFHRVEEPSGSEARCIKNPPKPEQPAQDLKVAIGAHTDFGSLVRNDQCLRVLQRLTRALSPSCITASEVFKFSLQVIQNGTMSKYALS